MCVGSGSLFSILLLCRIMDIAYCTATTLISSNVCLMFILEILNIVSNFFIEGVCVPNGSQKAPPKIHVKE